MPGHWPSLVNTSLWHTPQAWTLIRTDPGPGSGIGRSTSSRGPPGRETWATRIVAMKSLQTVGAPSRATRRVPPAAGRIVFQWARVAAVLVREAPPGAALQDRSWALIGNQLFGALRDG